MQKSVCWAFMHRRDDQLRHADNDCKNSFIIQGTPQVKGLLLFKAAAGFTDNQEQLLLWNFPQRACGVCLKRDQMPWAVFSSASGSACYRCPCRSGEGGCWRCWALREWPSECERCRSAWRAPPPGPVNLSLETQRQYLLMRMRASAKVHKNCTEMKLVLI